jgi:hypothetical protein
MRNRRDSGSPPAAAARPASTVTMSLLGAGAHARPASGANVLELASVLAGDYWSSCPESVHPALAVVAGLVNDLVDDEHRRLLTPLAPWLLRTDPAGPGAWPAVISVCERAAPASSRPPKPAGWPNRRRVRRAIRAAQTSWAGVGGQCAADGLSQLLLDCINECRRLAGEPAVDPRLPLQDCPEHLTVRPLFIWKPGCDWMHIGYRPVPGDLPACLRRTAADPASSSARSPAHGTRSGR